MALNQDQRLALGIVGLEGVQVLLQRTPGFRKYVHTRHLGFFNRKQPLRTTFWVFYAF